MDKNSLPYTIVFSFVITFLLVFLLALANTSTLEIVEQNQRVRESSSVLNALGVSFNPNNPQEILAQYRSLERTEFNGQIVYMTEVNGNIVYALPYRGTGVWGPIDVVLGFKGDLSRFTGITIVGHSETPGLGARIEEPWFQEQFVDQRIPETGSIAVVRGSGTGDTNKDNYQIDSITGATGTSNGMRALIANAVDTMRQFVGGNS
jgi:Na+-transporting NADH:ubiquinone oxidoreductase subunit C